MRVDRFHFNDHEGEAGWKCGEFLPLTFASKLGNFPKNHALLFGHAVQKQKL